MMEPNGYWARFWDKRMSRRRMLGGVMVAGGGLAAAALVGCSSDSTTSTTTATEGKPVTGGSLTRTAQFEIQGGQLDPHTIPTTWTQDYKLWYQSLLIQDPLTLDLNGQLAERWEVVSPTEYVFHLRRGVMWHNKPPVNGRELVANDVVFSMERIRTNNPRFISRSALVSVDQITAVDPYTVYGRGKTAHYMQINVAVTPFNNPNVVKALRLLINHQEMLEAIGKTYLGGGSHGQLLPVSLTTWDLTQQEYETYAEWRPGKDAAIRDALALLSSAGFTAANPLSFELLGRVENPGDYLSAEVELLQSQWRQNSQGILKPTLRTVDQATINTVQTNRQYQVMKAGNGGIANDPDSHFSAIVATGGSRNYMGYSDATLDGMITRQRQEFDLAKRKALIKEINVYLIDHGPITMDLQYLNAAAASNRVHGYVPEGELPTIYNGDLYDDIWVTG
ncbi:MAG TPA: ABC transporter substrate-binding protein [Dehalococcoidia bacterium]|nr:ABC transporter substrate-binding protein [Dehalococcoidia bacterium]